MPGREALFDTNAMIAWMEPDTEFARAFPDIHAPCVSLISLAELRYGAKRSSQAEENLKNLERAISRSRLLLPDEATADTYAEISLGLRRKGRPIPTNDIWIAATALDHGLPLITRDAHFREISGLAVLGW